MENSPRIQQGREEQWTERERIREASESKPTHLDLFSGIGGFALAAQWAGFRTIGFCEIDGYCQKVLAKNFLADTCFATITTGDNGREEHQPDNGTKIRDFNSPSCPRLFSNIFNLDGTQFRGVTLITGGFPCQPFSVAGKRGGAADDRAIWPQMFRVISEARPAWVLGENVPGIIPMELDNVLSDLEGIGYATRTFVIPACAVDARHRRDRVWIVAHATGGRFEQCDTESKPKNGPLRPGISYTRHEQSSGRNEIKNGQQFSGRREAWSEPTSCCLWEPEPDVGRVAHGIPSRVDRLKGLGNAIVPQVAYEILREIRKLC